MKARTCATSSKAVATEITRARSPARRMARPTLPDCAPHTPHQGAQKATMAGRPRREASDTTSPSRVRSATSGGVPRTWARVCQTPMPGMPETGSWPSARVMAGSEPSGLFGTCQRFEMTSIGATSVVVRSFRPADDAASATDRAGELVAEFPDSTTARRAFAVLRSWRAKCADRLKRYDRSHVGALEDVSVNGGTGGWYLLTYGPVPRDPDVQYFDAQGIAVVGSRIAMVEMVLAGQDYNYDAGKEPMVAAVQRAAAKLS